MQQALTHVLLMDAVVSALQPSGATWGASHLSCCEKMQSESKKRLRAAPWRPERLHRGGPFCPPHLALTCALEPRAWSRPLLSSLGERHVAGRAVGPAALRPGGARRDPACLPAGSRAAARRGQLRGACARRVPTTLPGRGARARGGGGRCPRSFLRSRCARGPRLELAPLPADVDVALALGGPRGSVAGPLPLACRSVFGSRKQQTGEDVSHRGRYRRSAEAAARGSQAGSRAGSAGAWRRSLRQLHGHTPRSRSAVGLGHRRHPRKKPCPV